MVQMQAKAGSPTTIPTGVSIDKEWTGSLYSMNLTQSFDAVGMDDPVGMDDSNVDFELDEAVHKALGTSRDLDETASQTTDSGVYMNDDVSVFSENKSLGSKSAVQLRLERRKKPRPPTAEMFKSKLEAASERRNKKMSFVAQRISQHFDDAKKVAERMQTSHVESIKEKSEKKQSLATERREKYMHGITSKLHEKMEKVSSTRSVLAGDNVTVKELQEKLEQKQLLAAERRQQMHLDITAKMQDKMEKVWSIADADDMSVQTLQEKLEKKLTRAAERRQLIYQDKLLKITSTTSMFGDEDDASVQELQDKLDRKILRATQRREQHMLGITSKLQEKLEKVSSTRRLLDTDDVSVQELQEKLEQKQLQATERRQKILDEKLEKVSSSRNVLDDDDMSVQTLQEKLEQKHLQAANRRQKMLNEKLEKVSSSRNVLDDDDMSVQTLQEKLEQKHLQAAERRQKMLQDKLLKLSSVRYMFDDDDASVQELQDNLEMKLLQATKRRDQHIQNITLKLHDKMEKVSSARSAVEQKHENDTKAIKERHEKKMIHADSTKTNIKLDFSQKMKAKMEKISESRKSAEIKLKEMGEKFAQKMVDANTRKEELMANGNSEQKKSDRSSNFKSTTGASVESKKQRLENKMSVAADKRQELLDAKVSKLSSYLATAHERGQEALKRKEELLSTKNEDEHFMSLDIGLLPLSSINELEELVADDASEPKQPPRDDNDEASINPSIASSTSTKSAVQIRLEQWEKPSLTKQALDAKLLAATQRRRTAIIGVREKANADGKMEKVSNKMQSAQIAIKNLEEKFTNKLFEASKRKEKIIAKSVEKASESHTKVNKSKEAQVTAMQKRLEDKLLAAIQRKENIVSAKVKKARGNVSLSSKRGRAALEQKEEIMKKVKSQNEHKHKNAMGRRKRLRELEKEKRDVMMMRRLMAQNMSEDDDVSVSSKQEQLESKLNAAYERKKSFIAAKVSKAADHISSTTERGQEIQKHRESLENQLKNESENKLESALRRKARLTEGHNKKKELRNKRREAALALSRQKREEAELITAWEAKQQKRDPLPSVTETSSNAEDSKDDEEESKENDANDYQQETKQATEDNSGLPRVEVVSDDPDPDSYDGKRLAARRQLVEEIRLANEVKRDELDRLSRERRELDRRELSRPQSIRNRDMSIGSIDTNDLCSFDEEDISISGLSTVKEEETKTDRRKAQAALALAELDIKLSEIQIMQAILLAEEASINGEESFRTTDKSITDLNNVKVSLKIEEDKNGVKRVRKSARNFFVHTMKSAKEAQQRAGQTVLSIRKSLTENEKRSVFRRSNTAPSTTTDLSYDTEAKE